MVVAAAEATATAAAAAAVAAAIVVVVVVLSSTEWQPRRGKRSRGRPSRRWQDDITEKEGTT